MAKLVCKCGEIIDLSIVPNPAEYYFVSVMQWDELVRDIVSAVMQVGVADQVLLRENISDTLAGFARYFYKCPHCDDLIVLWNGDERPSYYQPVSS